MPNWVKTIVKTNPNVLKDIIGKYSENGVFSFDKIIPMPKDLRIESGSRGENGLMYLFIESKDDKYKIKINEIFRSLNMFYSDIYRDKRFEEIENNFDKYKDDPKFKDSIELGKKYIENYEKYGHCNWYEWCCENWGTKWDASQCSYSGNTLIFETAWGFAQNVMLELSKKYPEVIFECEFADEGIPDNSGSIELKNGEIFREEYGLSYQKIEEIWNTYIEEQEEEIEVEI